MPVSSSNQSDPVQQTFTRMGRMMEEMVRELMRSILAEQGMGNGPPIEHVQTAEIDQTELPTFPEEDETDEPPVDLPLPPSTIPEILETLPKFPEPDPRPPSFGDLPIQQIIQRLDLEPISPAIDKVPPPPQLADFGDARFQLDPAVLQDGQLPEQRSGFSTADPLGMLDERDQRLRAIANYEPTLDDTIAQMDKFREQTEKHLAAMQRMMERMTAMFQTANMRVVNVESRLERTRAY